MTEAETKPPSEKRSSTLNDIGQKVVVGVVVAVVLGVLTVAWNFASNGSVVRALGGVTAAELDQKLDQRFRGFAADPATLLTAGKWSDGKVEATSGPIGIQGAVNPDGSIRLTFTGYAFRSPPYVVVAGTHGNHAYVESVDVNGATLFIQQGYNGGAVPNEKMWFIVVPPEMF